MAKGTLGHVIQRAIGDAAFRNKLRTDPDGALSGFDLTPAERAALQSGDATKLASFGVDQRMSKAFATGAVASGVTRLVGTDLNIDSAIVDDGGGSVDDSAASGRTALNDQHDVARSVFDADPSSAAAQINDGDGPFLSGSVDDPVASGRTALNDQHDVARSTQGDATMANPEGYHHEGPIA